MSDPYELSGTAAVCQRILEIETRFDIRILYAAEVGSRAWGFSHPKSDYDVRFIYVRRGEKYLSIDGYGNMVLGENNGIPIENDLDFHGWDLPKALDLAVRSNPSVLEWFNSPIVYTKIPDIYDLAQMAMDFFSPTTARNYYWSIAQGNLKKYFSGIGDSAVNPGMFVLEKYLHIIRPLWMVRWIEKFQTPNLPINLDALRGAVDVSPELSLEVDKLQSIKRSGQLVRGDKVKVIEDWVWSELDSRSCAPPLPRKENDRERANALFRAAVYRDHLFQ